MNTKKPTALLQTVFVALTLFSNLLIASDSNLQAYGSVKNGVRHVNVIEAVEIIKNHADIQILDVRTDSEFKDGHLKGSVNVDHYSPVFRNMLDELDRNVTWLVHCRSGVRSGKSVPLMQELGFTSIIHMDGGMLAWLDANLPTVKE